MILLYSVKDRLYNSVKRYLKYAYNNEMKEDSEYQVEDFYKTAHNFGIDGSINQICFILSYTINKVDLDYCFSNILDIMIRTDYLQNNKNKVMFFGFFENIDNDNPNNYYESFMTRLKSISNETHPFMYKICYLRSEEEMIKIKDPDTSLIPHK
jgi:hypothetical protein